jgi:hypothetical protein
MIDDRDKEASLFGNATLRRSTLSLGDLVALTGLACFETMSAWISTSVCANAMVADGGASAWVSRKFAFYPAK